MLVAKYNINAQRKIARIRATSDIITKIETDQDFIKAENAFKKHRKDGFKSIIDGSAASEDDVDITTFLNMYENIFLGISMDAYDEVLIFKYKRGAMLKHWEQAEVLIKHWRTEEGNDRLYEMYELFVEDWRQNYFVTHWSPFPEEYKHHRKSHIVTQKNWI